MTAFLISKHIELLLFWANTIEVHFSFLFLLRVLQKARLQQEHPTSTLSVPGLHQRLWGSHTHGLWTQPQHCLHRVHSCHKETERGGWPNTLLSTYWWTLSLKWLHGFVNNHWYSPGVTDFCIPMLFLPHDHLSTDYQEAYWAEAEWDSESAPRAHVLQRWCAGDSSREHPRHPWGWLEGSCLCQACTLPKPGAPGGRVPQQHAEDTLVQC